MKNVWGNYAAQKGLIEKGYFRKHSDRGAIRKAAEASCSDRIQRSRQSQEDQEEVIKAFKQLADAIGDCHEGQGEEGCIETHHEGFKGIQGSTQGRQEVEERPHQEAQEVVKKPRKRRAKK